MSYIHILAQADAAPAAAPAEAAVTTTQSAQQPAGAETAPQEPGMFGAILPFILIAVIFYFLLIRPQQKQQKEMKARQESLKRGQSVVTAGGIHGTVHEVKDHTITLEIAPHVIIEIAKQSIVQILPQETEAK